MRRGASPDRIACEEGEVRPRHVVSALAGGVVAGFWAAALVGLGLLAAFELAGSAMPPPGISSWTATIGAGLGGVLAGLFYVNVIAWLPGPIVIRSIT